MKYGKSVLLGSSGNSWMMFNFNLHHITLILIGYLSNISCSPLPFGLLSSQVSGNGITFSHVELPINTYIELCDKSGLHIRLNVSWV